MVFVGGFRETSVGAMLPHAVSFLVCLLVMWLSKQARWTALVPTGDPRE
jgi:hypothetical protein